jgi:hypothetical protein
MGAPTEYHDKFVLVPIYPDNPQMEKWVLHLELPLISSNSG